MAYINFPSPTPIFPALRPLAWPVHKEPTYTKQLVAAGITGHEYQISRQTFPRWTFSLSYGAQESWLRDQTQNSEPYTPLAGYTELEQIAGLYMMCLGPYGEFYYSDPDDNSRLGAPVWYTSLFSGGVYPDYQPMIQWGGEPFVQPLMFPAQGIASLDAVYQNNVALDPATYSVGATGHQIIFHPTLESSSGLTCDLHFYYRCRFLADSEEFSEWAKNLWQKAPLRFESVKP